MNLKLVSKEVLYELIRTLVVEAVHDDGRCFKFRIQVIVSDE